MIKFEVGKKYECGDSSLSPIVIIKRTEKTCTVRNDTGTEWRMRIKQDGESEIMIDSSVPQNWRGIFTYYAKFVKEVEE